MRARWSSLNEKTGKTTLLLNLARSLLTGQEFLARYAVRPVTGTVALINFEVSAAQLARWAHEHGVPDHRLYLVNLRGRRNPLDHPDDRAMLAERLRHQDVESLIVDPFGRAYTGASQNDSGEVGSWLVKLDQFARTEVGARDLVLTAHAGWNGERTRGSSALEDWADSIITLTKDDGEDGDAQRYLRAIGRDVDVDEDRLEYDPATRQLTMSGGGSRRQQRAAKHHQTLDQAVLAAITACPGLNGTQLAEAVRESGVGFQRGEVGHAATRLIQAGLVSMSPAKHGAKQYFPVAVSRPIPTYPDLSRRDSRDMSRPLPIGGDMSRDTTDPDLSRSICTDCGEPMTLIEPGQTTHPTCTGRAA